MEKKLKDLKKNEVFTLAMGSDKMYRLQDAVVAFDGTVYYLTKRAYGGGGTGFWTTNGEKIVNAKN